MRYQVKLTISLLLLWIFLLPSVTNLYGQDKPRIVVALFKYPGDIVTFTQFREMLSKKLLLLGGEFGNKHQYIRGLHCFDTQTSAPSKVEIIQSYWKSSDALEVMSGIILNENNRNLVSSTVYLFELKGSLSKDFITLKFPVASKQYQHTKDTHSLITLYALAMDAKRLKYSSDLITGYLAKARDIATDLSKYNNDPDLRSLKDAVEKELQEQKNMSLKQKKP